MTRTLKPRGPTLGAHLVHLLPQSALVLSPTRIRLLPWRDNWREIIQQVDSLITALKGLGVPPGTSQWVATVNSS